MARKRVSFISGDDFIASLPAGERAKIEARAKELIAEEMTLADLRKALAFTQEQLSGALGVGQEHVSRLEHRTDMLLSTLSSYVAAMGGKLELIVTFPDRQPVSISNLADVHEPRPARQRTRQGRKRQRKAA